VQSEPEALQDLRNVQQISDENRGEELKEKGNVEDEVPRLLRSGSTLNKTVCGRNGESQHRKNFGNRSHRRMVEGDCSRQKEDEMCGQHYEQKWAFDLLSPGEIAKKGLSICPDKSEIEKRQGDVENGDQDVFSPF